MNQVQLKFSTPTGHVCSETSHIFCYVNSVGVGQPCTCGAVYAVKVTSTLKDGKVEQELEVKARKEVPAIPMPTPELPSAA